MEIFNWIAGHWQDILAAWGGLVATATIIVKWTKTTKDDVILGKIVAFADWFSVVNPRPVEPDE